MNKQFFFLFLGSFFLGFMACQADEQVDPDKCAEINGYHGDFELVGKECICPESHYYIQRGDNHTCIEKGEYIYWLEADSNHCTTPNLGCFPNVASFSTYEWGQVFNVLPSGCLNPVNTKWNKLDDGSVEISFEIRPVSISDSCPTFNKLTDCEAVTGYAYGRSDPANTKIDIEVRYMDLCKDVELGKGYIYLRK